MRGNNRSGFRAILWPWGAKVALSPERRAFPLNWWDDGCLREIFELLIQQQGLNQVPPREMPFLTMIHWNSIFLCLHSNTVRMIKVHLKGTACITRNDTLGGVQETLRRERIWKGWSSSKRTFCGWKEDHGSVHGQDTQLAGAQKRFFTSGFDL